jgi:hypothetical protein
MSPPLYPISDISFMLGKASDIAMQWFNILGERFKSPKTTIAALNDFSSVINLYNIFKKLYNLFINEKNYSIRKNFGGEK